MTDICQSWQGHGSLASVLEMGRPVFSAHGRSLLEAAGQQAMAGPSAQGLLEAIAADLRTRLPALKTCEVHDGRWDAEEVKRWVVATPAVLVA